VMMAKSDHRPRSAEITAAASIIKAIEPVK
jgi:hypothetical protein